jgi:hypothetical protein
MGTRRRGGVFRPFLVYRSWPTMTEDDDEPRQELLAIGLPLSRRRPMARRPTCDISRVY